MKATKFATYILQILIVGMLLVAFLPVMPASAATPTLNIQISEQASQATKYEPTLNTENLVGSGGTTSPLPPGITGTGQVTIANSLTGGTDLYNVTVTFVQGYTTNWRSASGPTPTSIQTANGFVTVTFSKITHATPAVLNYDLNSNAHIPLTLTTSYSTNSVPAAVGQATTVTMKLDKDETTSGTSTVSNIQVTSTNAISGTWTFTAATPGTGSGTVSIPSNVVTWKPQDMAAGAAEETCTYTATIADKTPFMSDTVALTLHDMANDVLSYQINNGAQTAAGVSVSGHPMATTNNVGSQMTKEYKPGLGYYFTPIIQNNQPAADPVDFTLNSVNFWVVNNQDIAATPWDKKPTYTTGATVNLPTTITQGNIWTGAPIVESPTFVPAGFIQPNVTIADASGQIVKQYNSPSGTVTLLQRIYILNGYKIQVTKTVTEETGANAGTFDVTITVQNIGNLDSPTVYVYDIVPNAWHTASPQSPFSMSPAPVIAGGTAVSTPISGYAYYWNEGSIGKQSAGTTITYKLIGPSGYNLNDIWVVGVDPAQSVNIQTTPVLSNVSTMATANFESLAALGAAGLLLVGMVGSYRRKQ